MSTGKYYAYVWMDEHDRPLYVGKGTGSRALSHASRDDLPPGPKVVHVIPCASEKDALQLEAKIYDDLAARDAELLNKVRPRNHTNDLDLAELQYVIRQAVAKTKYRSPRMSEVPGFHYKAFGKKMLSGDAHEEACNRAGAAGYDALRDRVKHFHAAADVDVEAMDRWCNDLLEIVDRNKCAPDANLDLLERFAYMALGWLNIRERVLAAKRLAEVEMLARDAMREEILRTYKGTSNVAS